MTTEPPLLEREVEYRPAVPATLEAVHFELDQFCNLVNSELTSSVTDRWKLEFATACSEICSNIIKHAFADSPQPGTMVLHLKLFNNRVEVEFTDDGTLFDQEASTGDPAPGPDAEPPESGRGLQVARALVDTLCYRRSQKSKNHWLLVKMLP